MRALGYGLGLLRSIFTSLTTSTSDPANTNDINGGYYVGHKWINTATGNEWTCYDNTAGAAKWRHTPRFWDSTGPSSTLTGTVSETVLATLSLAAALPGTNGLFDIQNTWEVNNNANAKTASTKIGAAGAGTGGTIIRNPNLASTLSYNEIFAIKNENSASSQKAFAPGSPSGPIGGGGAATPTPAINTASAFDFIWTGTLANTGDSITLKAWRVVMYRPDIT